jgi:hypothetical protein
MPTGSTISCYDGHSRLFDEYQLAVIPHYQDALEAIADACERYLGKYPIVLDLGCGIGNASLAALKRMNARISTMSSPPP